MSPSKRSRKKGRIIVCSMLGAILLTVIILAVVNRSVLKHVFSPDDIVIFDREESIAVLKQLESAGGVGNIVISGNASVVSSSSDANDVNNDSFSGGVSSVSFSSADENINITGEYDGARLKRLSGEVYANQVRVSSIEDGKRLAGIMLAPYFTDDVISALLLRHSPDFIKNAMSDNINMSFDIGDKYHVTATGSANGKVNFVILVK